MHEFKHVSDKNEMMEPLWSNLVLVIADLPLWETRPEHGSSRCSIELSFKLILLSISSHEYYSWAKNIVKET